MLSTSELCEKLKVSRDWVNRHLRHLGNVQTTDNGIRMVMYDEQAVINHLNSIATFSRQTIHLDLSQFANANELEQWNLQLQELRNKNKKTINDFEKIGEIYSEFLKKILPPSYLEQHQLIDTRNRGILPWVAVQEQINSLDELQSIKQLQRGKSTELAYREIYKQAMIRVEIFGRHFFLADPNKYQYSILMPANSD